MDIIIRAAPKGRNAGMTPTQQLWAQAKDRLAAAVAALGYPGSLADLLADQLGSPGRSTVWPAISARRAPEAWK